MEGKKISFSFIKTKKLEKPIVEEAKDFIECVEEKSIKVIGGDKVEKKEPLVIPMQPNTLITAERLKQIAEEVEKAVEEPDIKQEPKDPEPDIISPENETLEQMAIRELMQDAKKEIKVEKAVLTLPVPAKTVMEGQKESTLDDYESVPIQDFGMAMLRGMGWTPGKEQSKYKPPQLRPKGLGLGADKVVKENQKKNASKDDKDKELTIVKNAYVKITTGKHCGCYGKVVSLDEENGRVMVDITMKKEIVSLSEFMMQPVTKAEFDKKSRVINSDSYEEYKNKELSNPAKSRQETLTKKSDESKCKIETIDRIHSNHRSKEGSSNGRRRDRNDSSSEEDRLKDRKKESKKYSSNESLSSLSDTERRHKHKKSQRRQSTSSSDSGSRRKHKKNKKKSDSSEKKRDIDKKRKGKKKKRDRDRSPNYKKHRK